jgi:hypothetical protein
MEEPDKAEPQDKDDNKQLGQAIANTELYKTVCEQLSGIFDPNDQTAINVSRGDTTPTESTPLPSTSDNKTTRAGRAVKPPNRMQLNNLTVDVFTALITENVKKQLGYKRDNSRNRSNSKNRGQERESRKDQFNGQDKRSDSKNRTRKDSKG